MGPKTMLSLAALAASALTASAFTAAVPGQSVRGKALFVRAGLFCASCHTLKAAASTGRDGPNLDKTKPSYARVVELVTKGHSPTQRWPTGMPTYAGPHGEITRAQIGDIAAFVYGATHK